MTPASGCEPQGLGLQRSEPHVSGPGAARRCTLPFRRSEDLEDETWPSETFSIIANAPRCGEGSEPEVQCTLVSRDVQSRLPGLKGIMDSKHAILFQRAVHAITLGKGI